MVRIFRLSLVYVLFGLCSFTIANSVANLRYRRQLPFPLDQIFQQNAAEISAPSTDLDFNAVGNGATIVQANDAESGAQAPTQVQLPQILSNLILAAGVQQAPAPQQLARTAMNSGL